MGDTDMPDAEHGTKQNMGSRRPSQESSHHMLITIGRTRQNNYGSNMFRPTDEPPIHITMSRPLSSTRRRRDRSYGGKEGVSEASAWSCDDGGQQQQQQQQLSRPRRRSWRRKLCDGVIFGMYGLLVTGGRSRVSAQFVDGGAVVLTCGNCECTGSSDDGSVAVFDNPSTEDRIVSVEGELSEISETSCGTSIFAVGSTIYELSGAADLESRGLGVLDMFSDACVTADTPSTADCYTSPTATLSLDDGVTVDVTFNLGTWSSGGKFYKSKVATVVKGASSVAQEIEDFCDDNGFLSQLFSITVLSKTYKYNFEFALPGESTSSDLIVSGGAASSAGDFDCGELAGPTPSPLSRTPSPTDAPTPGPVAEVDSVVSPAPAVAKEPPTGVDSSTVAGATPAPLAVTGAPGSVAISVAPTLSPAGAPTPAPSADDPTTSTADSSTTDNVEDPGCKLPISNPCTQQTSIMKTNNGIGSYYDHECEFADGEEPLVGCSTDGSSLCRQCYFDTPLYVENNPDEDVPEYPDCPCCVLEVYKLSEAANLNGTRCENVTPPPVALTEAPSTGGGQQGIEILAFDDAGWGMHGGEVAALAGLGLLTALTFFPFCSK
ncbi:unnamed protein product [Pylaiella littoralis]